MEVERPRIRKSTTVSGKRLIIITLMVCGLLVATALWQRWRGTMQIRQFWGAQSARLIQHATLVQVRAAGTQEEAWRNISQAPGLIHLRATLVDDRYYQWPATACAAEESSGRSMAWLFRFGNSAGEQVELAIQPATGRITNLETDRCVQLITASQQAVDEYLKQILP